MDDQFEQLLYDFVAAYEHNNPQLRDNIQDFISLVNKGANRNTRKKYLDSIFKNFTWREKGHCSVLRWFEEIYWRSWNLDN